MKKYIHEIDVLFTCTVQINMNNDNDAEDAGSTVQTVQQRPNDELSLEAPSQLTHIGKAEIEKGSYEKDQSNNGSEILMGEAADQKDEEDLLAYDSDADVVVENYDKNDDVHSDDSANGGDSIIDIVSDSEIQEAARQLLRTKAPKIMVNYKGICYLLFSEYDGDNAKEEKRDQVICADSTDLHRGCNIVFGRIRLFLQKNYGALELFSRELTFSIPELDLNMEEDNLYNKEVNMNDIVSIFKLLKDNSVKNCEENVPSHITMYVGTKPRFVARYNELVEMLSSDATFSNIKVFSNDRSHPVILDDGEAGSGFGGNPAEVIVMTSDEELEETENSHAATYEMKSNSLETEVSDMGETARPPFVTCNVDDKSGPSNSDQDVQEPQGYNVNDEEKSTDDIEDSLKRRRDSASENDSM